MSLSSKIDSDLKDAMRAKDAVRMDTLRMIKAAITNAAIEKKKDGLEDSENMAILQKQAKQRKESREAFEKAGRIELAQKEQAELQIIESYLPKQLSDDELTLLIREVLQETGASMKSDTGKIMKALMPKIAGRADGKRINQILGGLLA